MSYTAGNFVKQVRRRNRTNEGGEYMSGKSVKSLRRVDAYGKRSRRAKN
jgi:hypothetical protein